MNADSDNWHDPDHSDAADATSRTATVTRLFREHNEALTRFLAARLRSVQEAQEVAQEAYVRVLNLDEPGAVSFLRAFLYKTAANLAVDRIRSRERRASLRAAGACDELGETPTPERSIQSRQEIAVVERLLGELPPKCRQAFLLNRVHGLDPEEISKQMGVAQRTVRHYILRAFLYCRAGLDAAEQPTDGSATPQRHATRDTKADSHE